MLLAAPSRVLRGANRVSCVATFHFCKPIESLAHTFAGPSEITQESAYKRRGMTVCGADAIHDALLREALR